MRKDAPGFTLVECLAALAVAATLCGLALPAMHDTLRRQRTATALHLVSAQLAQARMTAIMQRRPVTVCPSVGDGKCLGTPDWSGGWLLYRDPGRRPQPDSGADILRDVRAPFAPQVRVFSSPGRLRIRYQPDGRSAGSNITLRVCNSGQLVGELTVNNVGRSRTRRISGNVPCPY